MNFNELPDQDSSEENPNPTEKAGWGLQVTDGPPGKVWRPLAGVFRIGRSGANDLEIPDQKVSRFHAFVRQLGSDIFEIVDLGSTNGTHVNGRRITSPTRLNPGHTIRIGETEMMTQGPKLAVQAGELGQQGPGWREVVGGVKDLLKFLEPKEQKHTLVLDETMLEASQTNSNQRLRET
jgi:predicted component of type VI protein secretion system